MRPIATCRDSSTKRSRQTTGHLVKRSGTRRERRPANLPEMPEGYRSYVVRVRTRQDHPDAIQVEVEDLLGHRLGRVNGGAARTLGDQLESVSGIGAEDLQASSDLPNADSSSSAPV